MQLLYYCFIDVVVITSGLNRQIHIGVFNNMIVWAADIVHKPSQNGIWLDYLVTWTNVSLKIFLNGELLKETNMSHPTTYRRPTTSPRLAIGRYFMLKHASKSSAKMYFDDFKIWERSLNDMEAVNVYHSGELCYMFMLCCPILESAATRTLSQQVFMSQS